MRDQAVSSRIRWDSRVLMANRSCWRDELQLFQRLILAVVAERAVQRVCVSSRVEHFTSLAIH
jgi:hypothetical protein